jgi:hypothetical protein
MPIESSWASMKPHGNEGPTRATHARSTITLAAELGRGLDHFRAPTREKDEILKAFAAHKD